MLLDVVACCCAKFETGQTFQPTTPDISFVPWSPKRSATTLDPFAQLFQGVAYAHYALFTTPNIVRATMLGVVASVCTQPKNSWPNKVDGAKVRKQSITWCICWSTNLNQLWIKRGKLAFPNDSSTSFNTRPSAAASGMVRKARRKLLACGKQKNTHTNTTAINRSRERGTSIQT